MEDKIVINGDVDLTALLEAYNAGHSGFFRRKNGHICANTTEWINGEPNQYGQHSSTYISSGKDKEAADNAIFGKRVYIGNGTKGNLSGQPIAAEGREKLSLPGEPAPPAATSGGGQPAGGLPF
jgi:hypothetical protein